MIRPIPKTRRNPHRFTPRLEALDDRTLPDATIPGVTLDPLLVPKFVNPLPQALDPGFIYQPAGTARVTLQSGVRATVPRYDVGMYEIRQNLGLGLKDASGNPVKTTVWGYGTSATTATYPGRSFEVQSGQPIAVRWSNGLTATRHLLPMDPTTLNPADSTANGGQLYTVTPQTVANTAVTGTTSARLVTFPGGIPAVPHVHGGHTQAAFDGTPLQWFTPAGLRGADHPGTNTFTYDNSQPAGTIWYHDHAVGTTRLNVYAGLAGFYIIRDANESALVANHSLPGKPYDIPLAIQDRMFTAPGGTGPADPGGQLYYPADVLPGTTATYPSNHPEFFGDTILVNGQAWPVLDVEPRTYRFRVLNGSQARFYDLQLTAQTGGPTPIVQVGTDDGLLGAPVPLSHLLIAPGERADVVVDFSQLAGKTVIMTNSAKGPFPKGTPGDPQTTGQIMAFRVRLPKSAVPDTVLPAALSTVTPFAGADNTRDLALYELVDRYGRLAQNLGTLAGPKDFLNSPITEVIRQGDREIWKVYNTTADTHPIHLHQVSFQVLGRQGFNWKIDPATGGVTVTGLAGQPRGPAANEAGWKDTVQMNPGEVTVIEARFDLPGKYVWHCHILEHEEHDMMQFFQVVPPSAGPLAAAPLPGATAAPTDATLTAAVPANAQAIPTAPASGGAAAAVQAVIERTPPLPDGELIAAPLGSRRTARPGWGVLDGMLAEFDPIPVDDPIGGLGVA